MWYIIGGILGLLLISFLGRKIIGIIIMALGVLLLTSFLIGGVFLILVGFLILLIIPRRSEYV